MKKFTGKAFAFVKKHWIAFTAAGSAAVFISVIALLVIIAVTGGGSDISVFSFDEEILSEEESIDVSLDSKSTVVGEHYGTAEKLDVSELGDLSKKAKCIGIDVSVWQGEIDWAKVAAAGIDFAMIRCGYREYGSAGAVKADRRFERNIQGALQNGIKVGVYFYSTAVNREEAEEEARWVADAIDGYDITFPVAYDFEEFFNSDDSRAKSISKAQLTLNTVTFLEYIKQRGYKPMLYASASAVRRYWDYQTVKNYDYWLAHYTRKTNYSGPYTMWQCTSNGRVDGINGHVDFDIAYVNYS